MNTKPILLAIECSARGAEVALAVGDRLHVEPVDAALGSAAGLIPAIDRAAQKGGIAPAALDAIAVTIGPGSFTGLRVGVTTAKALAYSTGAALIGLDTLHLLAEQAAGEASEVWPLLDAGRGECYSARYVRQPNGRWTESEPAAVRSVAELRLRLAGGAAIGPGASLLTGGSGLPAVHIVSVEGPRASTAARLGLERLAAGATDDPASLAPRYLRRPAAEEKAESAEAKAAARRAE